MPRSDGAMFHAVTCGTCWVTRRPNDAPLRLQAGDLVVFPRGEAHVLADEPGRPTRSMQCLVRSRWLVNGRMRGGGDGPRTDFICGLFRVDHDGRHPLWSQLPAVVHLRGTQAPRGMRGLESTLGQLEAEVRHPRLGSELVVTRLLDVLVVEIVRAWLTSQGPVSEGWLGGMRDGNVGAALGLIHQSPERDWSVAVLAEAAGTSRTVFAERFSALVGEGPIAYLTRVRMQTAAALLRLGPADTMISVAERVGYGSEAAFSKAFKRVRGISPGAYRRAVAAGRPELAP